MIAAFARAGARARRRRRRGGRGRLVPRERGAGRGVRARRAVAGRLAHAAAPLSRRRTPAIEGYAEDYAYLICGLLELFQADRRRPSGSNGRSTLQPRQDELFWDDADGGWFSTTGRDPSVLLRLKEDYDGAEPAASSVAVLNLLTLAHLTGDAEALAKAERTLARFGPRIGAAGRAVPFMLSNLSAWHAGPKQTQIVLVGPRDREDTRALRSVLTRTYLPFATVISVDRVGDREGTRRAGGAGAAAALDWRDGPGRRARGGLCLPEFHVRAARHRARGAGRADRARLGVRSRFGREGRQGAGREGYNRDSFYPSCRVSRT